MIDEVAPWCADQLEPIASICRGYVNRKRLLGLVDFDDLLLYWRAAAADDRPGAAARFRDRSHLCRRVSGRQRVAGRHPARPAQPRPTIDGRRRRLAGGVRLPWREPRHLLDIESAFPAIATILLERNYRSVQPILDVANAVSTEAPEGFMARLRAEVPAGERPRLVRCADEDAQVDAVCERVLAHREEGISLQAQAVLVRAGITATSWSSSSRVGASRT